jgi:gliding motility-associated-like protein
MKTPQISTLKTAFLLSCFLLTSIEMFAQVAVPFSVRYQRTLKGDMTMISNNIVNRQTNSTSPNTPYNTTGNNSEYNDNLNMRYIDIDGDASTFSSSSATLALPASGCNKIVYAGLYWSATYRFNNGYSTTANDGDRVRQNNFNQIRFKVPGGNYVDITGQTIFDGFTNPNFIANSPYACYADVTSLVTALNNPEGVYTAANIKATQGYINGGGVSGGWTMFVVYENPTMTGKYITAYDGFAGVRSDIGQTDINYSGFTTLPAPFPVRARLASAALEGDNRITGDQLMFKAASNPTFTALGNTLNTTNNFFNSRLTINDTDFTTRLPNSINTLGYDSDIIIVNNPLNNVIPNNETAATLRITSTQDTYFMFFNAFNIEIIEPDIKLVKTVQNVSGTDIGGADVNLGQVLDYVITFQNVGNDNATNATIRDILPINTIFQSVDLSGAPGVTYTIDANNDELIFNLPNGLVEVGDPIYTIRIRVRVVETCDELEDACSNVIQNQAYTTYSGLLNNNVISNDPSFAGLDSCGFGQPGPANFLVDMDNCIFAKDAYLCGSSVRLTAANGYAAYAWYNSAGQLIGNTQSITVSQVGTYTVANTAAAPPCIGITQTFTVRLFGETQTNPVIPFADEVVTCPNDGELLPLIFLCGTNDSKLIQTGISDAVSIVWEKLNESSCTAVGIETCANKNASCQWNPIGTGANFNATTSGQYRITINYQDGCFTRFYFNVYTNLLDIQYTTTNILCNTPGSISVTNLPNNYQFQLVNQTTGTILVPFQSNPIFSIAQSGVYTIQVTQNGVVEGCVFELKNIGIQGSTFQTNVITNHSNCNGFGSIRMQATGALPQYMFSITSPVAVSSGWVSDNDYTFSNLNPGAYTFEMTSEDGCVYTGTTTIIDESNLALTANVSQNITCAEGNIQMHATGGKPPYTYAVYSYNGTLQNPTSADYQSSVIFDIPFGQQGTYVFIVVDRNNCTALSNPVTIELVPNIQFTTNVQNVSCFGQNNGSISYNVTSSNGYQLSYQLLDENGNIIRTNSTGTFNNLAAGNYTVNLIQSRGNKVCEFPFEFTITEPTQITGISTVTQNYTCITNAGTIAIQPGSVTGGIAPYTYSIDGINFGSATSFTGLAAGTYTIIIKDANNCTFATNAITFTPLNYVTDITFTTTQATCPSLTTNVTLNVVGGAGPYTYQIIAPTTTNNGTNNTFLNLTAGTYTFLITDATGCTYQENYTIPTTTPIDVIGQSISAISCFGASEGSLVFTVTTINPYNYQVTNSAGTVIVSGTHSTLGTITVNGLPASSYTMVVTDTVTQCNDTVAVSIQQPTMPLSMATTVSPITCINNGGVTITANGGWGSYQYQLIQPNGSTIGYQNTNIFTNLTQTGTYTVAVKDINGCIVSNTFTLTTPINLVAAIAPSSSLCYDVDGASIAVAVTGGVVPYTYSINGNPTQNSNVFNNLAPGNYIITITDAYGCTTTVSQTITTQFSGSSNLVKGLDCTASPNAEIAGTVTGGLAPFTYQVAINGGTWSSSTTIIGTAFTYPTPTAGNYQFLFTDSQGCTSTSPIINIVPLTQPSIISATQTQEILCNGGSDGAIEIVLNPTLGQAPYDFTIINTTLGVNYGNQTSGLKAGTYQITVTDANNCTDTIAITLTEPDVLNFNVSTVDITCNNPGGTSFGEIVVNNVVGGTAPYTYYVTNNFGFIATYNTTSNENHSFQILTFGIYKVEVVDANGCNLFHDNIIIASPPSDLFIDVSTSTSDCTNGGTAIITVSSAVSSGSYEFAILQTNAIPYSSAYQPADPGTPETSTFTGLIPGVIYTFVVHDLVTDCYYFKTADTPINTPSTLLSTLTTVANVSCTGSGDGFVSFTVANYAATTTSISYEIFKSQSNISTTITGNITGLSGTMTVNNAGPLAPGTYYILFTEMGGALSGCTSASVPFTISQSSQILQLTATVTRNDNCNANRGRITALGQYGTAPYQYQLVASGNPAPTVATWAGSSTNTFNIEGGNYVVYIKDANNCIQSQSIFVPTDPTPVITASVTNLCTATQGNFTIEVTLATPSIAPYTFSLNGGAYQTQTVPTFTYTQLTSGNYVIRVKDANNCTHNVTVAIPQILNASPAVTQQVSCLGNDGIITVTPNGGSGNYTFELQTTAGVTLVPAQTSNVLTGIAPGNYVVVLHDTTTTCTANVPVELTAPVPVTFTITSTNVTCNSSNDGTLTVTLDTTNSNGPYVYSISNGVTPTITQNNGIFTGLIAGSYTVTVTSSRNCTMTETVVITEPSALAITATATDFACNSENVVQTSTLSVSVTNDGTGNPSGTAPYLYSIDGNNFFTTSTFDIVNTGTIQNVTVTVKDAHNCMTTTNIVINPITEITVVTAATVTAITCTNDAIVAVTVNGGSGNFTFDLLPLGTQPSLTPGNGIYAVNFNLYTPGSYVFQVTDNVTGCYSLTDVYEIAPFDTIAVSIVAATPVTCFGDTNGTYTIDVTGYTGNYTYEVKNSANTVLATGNGTTTINPFTISGLTGGNYQVVITAVDSPYCVANSNFMVIPSPSDALTLQANQTASVTCLNNAGEIVATATGGWGTHLFELVNTTTNTTLQSFGTNSIFTGLTTGNYTVTVRDAGGCTISTSLILTQPNFITGTIQVGNANLLCYGDTNGNVAAINVTGGEGIYQYILNTYDATGTIIITSSDAQLNPIFNGLGTGIYSITIADGWNCDFTTNTVTITQPTPVVASLTVISTLTCTSQATLSLSATGGTAPYIYSTDGINFNSTNTFNVGPGRYQFYVKDANNCAIAMSNEIRINAIPVLDLNLNLNSANINCSGESTGVIIADATGGLGNYQYSLLNSSSTVLAGPQTSGTFTNLPAGQYLVKVDSEDCTTTSEVIPISEPELLAIASLDIQNVVCFGGENGSVTITTSGGTGMVQFAISPNLNQYFNDGTFNNLVPGHYTVVVQDQKGCFIVLDFEIIEPAPLEAEAINIVQDLCIGEQNGYFELNITGGTAPYSTSLNSPDSFIENQLSFSNLLGGTDYFIFVKDANGCETMAYVWLNHPVEVTPSVSVTAACNDNAPINNLTVSVNESAIGNVQFALDGGAYQTSNVFENVATGYHTVSVQHINGCTKTLTVDVDELQPISIASVNVDNVLCNGASTGSVTVITAGGNGTILYAISPNVTSFGTQNVFTNLAAGIYTIVVKDSIGCSTQQQITITTPEAIVITPTTIIQELCSGDNNANITIAISGGVAPYATSLDNATGPFISNQVTFNNLTGGRTYTIFVKDANGCVTSIPVTLNTPVTITPTVAVTYTCTNNAVENTVTININTVVINDVTYSLDGGAYQTSNQFTNLTPGSHTVAVQHTNGCTKTIDFVIENKLPISIDTMNVQNVLCNGASTGSVTTTTTGGTGTIEYAISPNLTTFTTQNVFSNLAAGTYTVIVKDSIGCSVQQEITITTPNAITITTNQIVHELCVGERNGSITIDVTGGVGPYATSLNNANGTFVANQMTFNNLTGGLTYTIYVKDANGCVTSIPVTLNTPVSITPTAAVTYTCTNNAAENMATITVNTTVVNDVTYSLDGGAYQNSNVFMNLVDGSHTVMVRHTNGCEKQVTFVIAPSIPIQATFTTVPVNCNGGNNGRITISATGGNGLLQYAISPNLTSFSSSNVFNSLPGGTYTVIVQDSIGCQMELNISLAQPDAVTATIATVFPDVCYGDNLGAIEIAISGGTAPYQTSLNNTNTYVTNQVLFDNLAGNQSYTVYVKDAKGCETSIAVYVEGAIKIDGFVDINYGCVDSNSENSVTVNVNNDITSQVNYSLNGTPFQNNRTFTNLSNGNHTIMIVHDSGCTEEISFNISNLTPLTVIVNATNLNQYTAVATGGSGIYTYYLNGNQINSNVFNIFATATYTLTVKDSNGCTVDFIFNGSFVDIDVPNFFTPNDDGDNDTWHPTNMEGFPRIQVEVFDRYGRIIHHFGQNGSWDGKYNGNLLPTGDYWYTITLDDGRQFVGNMTLYR